MSDFSKESILERIDRVSRENGHGDLTSAVYNSFYGINHRGTGTPVPGNQDQHGLTFFTRPNLNLSYDNIKIERIFMPLLDKRQNSMFRAIRLLLDPDATDDYNGPVESRLVNRNNPFIPLLSNRISNMSGWPDIALDSYASKEGRAREAWAMGDGKTRIFSIEKPSVSFRNMVGDPITLLFFYWVHYISLVYEGTFVPKPQMILENEIDYMTRIYRLVLDPTRTYVRKISCCGAAFPVSVPMGAAHNFSDDKPYNGENEQITINLVSMGVDYLDPIIVKEFNTVVSMFSKSTDDVRRISLIDENNKSGYVKLNKDIISLMNHKGIPWIDPITYELEWYMKEEEYNQELSRGAELLQAPATRNISSTTRPTTTYGVLASDGIPPAGPENLLSQKQRDEQSKGSNVASKSGSDAFSVPFGYAENMETAITNAVPENQIAYTPLKSDIRSDVPTVQSPTVAPQVVA